MAVGQDVVLGLLRSCFEVGVSSAQPSVGMASIWAEQIKPWLEAKAPERQQVWVVGAGKAAASMVQALEACAGDSERLKGVSDSPRAWWPNTPCGGA